MKIREGFVSNSSSTSFVIKIGNLFNSTVEVAHYMLNSMKENREDKTMLEFINKKIDSLKNITDPNSPICFDSCNYETYIRKIDDLIFIFTCSNENWGSDIYEHSPVSNKAMNIILGSSKNKIDLDDEDKVTYGWHELFDDYYSLDINAVGKYSNTSCKKCNHTKFRLFGSKKDICPHCNPEVFDDSLRELQEKEYERKYKKLYMIVYKTEPIAYTDKIINELLKTIEGGSL